MVVENTELIRETANQISDKLLLLVKDNVTNPAINDDPAESIYLMLHTLSSFLAKSITTLCAYRKIYGIEKLCSEDIMDWVFRDTKHYLELIKHNKAARGEL